MIGDRTRLLPSERTKRFEVALKGFRDEGYLHIAAAKSDFRGATIQKDSGAVFWSYDGDELWEEITEERAEELIGEFSDFL